MIISDPMITIVIITSFILLLVPSHPTAAASPLFNNAPSFALCMNRSATTSSAPSSASSGGTPPPDIGRYLTPRVLLEALAGLYPPLLYTDMLWGPSLGEIQMWCAAAVLPCDVWNMTNSSSATSSSSSTTAGASNTSVPSSSSASPTPTPTPAPTSSSTTAPFSVWDDDNTTSVAAAWASGQLRHAVTHSTPLLNASQCAPMAFLSLQQARCLHILCSGSCAVSAGGGGGYEILARAAHAVASAYFPFSSSATPSAASAFAAAAASFSLASESGFGARGSSSSSSSGGLSSTAGILAFSMLTAPVLAPMTAAQGLSSSQPPSSTGALDEERWSRSDWQQWDSHRLRYDAGSSGLLAMCPLVGAVTSTGRVAAWPAGTRPADRCPPSSPSTSSSPLLDWFTFSSAARSTNTSTFAAHLVSRAAQYIANITTASGAAMNVPPTLSPFSPASRGDAFAGTLFTASALLPIGAFRAVGSGAGSVACERVCPIPATTGAGGSGSGSSSYYDASAAGALSTDAWGPLGPTASSTSTPLDPASAYYYAQQGYECVRQAVFVRAPTAGNRSLAAQGLGRGAGGSTTATTATASSASVSTTATTVSAPSASRAVVDAAVLVADTAVVCASLGALSHSGTDPLLDVAAGGGDDPRRPPRSRASAQLYWCADDDDYDSYVDGLASPWRQATLNTASTSSGASSADAFSTSLTLPLLVNWFWTAVQRGEGVAQPAAVIGVVGLAATSMACERSPAVLAVDPTNKLVLLAANLTLLTQFLADGPRFYGSGRNRGLHLSSDLKALQPTTATGTLSGLMPSDDLANIAWFDLSAPDTVTYSLVNTAATTAAATAASSTSSSSSSSSSSSNPLLYESFFIHTVAVCGGRRPISNINSLPRNVAVSAGALVVLAPLHFSGIGLTADLLQGYTAWTNISCYQPDGSDAADVAALGGRIGFERATGIVRRWSATASTTSAPQSSSTTTSSSVRLQNEMEAVLVAPAGTHSMLLCHGPSGSGSGGSVDTTTSIAADLFLLPDPQATTAASTFAASSAHNVRLSLRQLARPHSTRGSVFPLYSLGGAPAQPTMVLGAHALSPQHLLLYAHGRVGFAPTDGVWGTWTRRHSGGAATTGAASNMPTTATASSGSTPSSSSLPALWNEDTTCKAQRTCVGTESFVTYINRCVDPSCDSWFRTYNNQTLDCELHSGGFASLFVLVAFAVILEAIATGCMRVPLETLSTDLSEGDPLKKPKRKRKGNKND